MHMQLMTLLLQYNESDGAYYIGWPIVQMVLKFVSGCVERGIAEFRTPIRKCWLCPWVNSYSQACNCCQRY